MALLRLIETLPLSVVKAVVVVGTDKNGLVSLKTVVGPVVTLEVVPTMSCCCCCCRSWSSLLSSASLVQPSSLLAQ